MFYTQRAMTVYEMPRGSPYQRQFRFLGWGAVIVLLGILLFSMDEPAGLSPSAGHVMGWLAGAIVLGAVVGATVLAGKEGTWRLLRKLRFEISDGRIIRFDEASSSIEIPLEQIEYLHEYGGWLLVGGGTPRRQITIPKKINGFDLLKRELAQHCTLTLVKVKVHPLLFLPLVLMIVAYFFLFTSHARAVVIAAGVAALALQGVGTYSLRLIWREKTMPKLVMFTFVLTWLILAWLVYQRVMANNN
jgi:hypothetical protein